MRHIRVLICQVDDGTPDLMSEVCPGWVAHPWLKAMGRAVDTAPGHRASARCDQAASVGGRGASERADDLTSQHRWPPPPRIGTRIAIPSSGGAAGVTGPAAPALPLCPKRPRLGGCTT